MVLSDPIPSRPVLSLVEVIPASLSPKVHVIGENLSKAEPRPFLTEIHTRSLSALASHVGALQDSLSPILDPRTGSLESETRTKLNTFDDHLKAMTAHMSTLIPSPSPEHTAASSRALWLLSGRWQNVVTGKGLNSEAIVEAGKWIELSFYLTALCGAQGIKPDQAQAARAALGYISQELKLPIIDIDYRGLCLLHDLCGDLGALPGQWQQVYKSLPTATTLNGVRISQHKENLGSAVKEARDIKPKPIATKFKPYIEHQKSIVDFLQRSFGWEEMAQSVTITIYDFQEVIVDAVVIDNQIYPISTSDGRFTIARGRLSVAMDSQGQVIFNDGWPLLVPDNQLRLHDGREISEFLDWHLDRR